MDVTRPLELLTHSLSRSRRAARLAAMVRNQAERVVQQHFFRTFERAEAADARWLSAVAPAIATFLDVGANAGDWTAQLLAVAPRAKGILFEPGSAARSAAEERFVGRRGIEVRAQALADRPGTATFHEGIEWSRSSSLLPGVTRGATREVTVEVTTIDATLARLSWPRVSALKIDCEGFDLDVLRGGAESLARGRIDVVQFEYNYQWRFRGATLSSAVRLLESNGYDVLLLLEEGLVQLPFVRYGEYFTYSNYLALRRGSPAAARLAPLIVGRSGF